MDMHSHIILYVRCVGMVVIAVNMYILVQANFSTWGQLKI